MARNRKRKTVRQPASEDRMKTAVIEVVEKGCPLQRAADIYNVKRTTLRRYVQKYKTAGGAENVRFVPHYDCRRIFTDEQEQLLADYLITAAKHHYGLSPATTRTIAMEFAMKNDIDVPDNWLRDSTAGQEWLIGFMRRHPQLSVRVPEAMSLGRSTAFNKFTKDKFMDNLEIVYKRYEFTPDRIFNCDETAVTTVQKPHKIIAPKGSKQVAAVTSQERGQLVTACCTINALGNTIPPFMVFPRVHFKNHMLLGAPPGAAGSAHPSGWMTSCNFVLYLKHFIKYSHCSVNQPALLILDNHESHVSIESIDLCKANGVILLTIPPHCSHRLQPLDVAVYGPLKRHYSNACTSWLHGHPGVPMTIMNVASCFGVAYQSAFTPKNILSGFTNSGIWPFDRDRFTEDDFEGKLGSVVYFKVVLLCLSITNCSSVSYRLERLLVCLMTRSQRHSAHFFRIGLMNSSLNLTLKFAWCSIWVSYCFYLGSYVNDRPPCADNQPVPSTSSAASFESDIISTSNDVPSILPPVSCLSNTQSTSSAALPSTSSAASFESDIISTSTDVPSTLPPVSCLSNAQSTSSAALPSTSSAADSVESYVLLNSPATCQQFTSSSCGLLNAQSASKLRLVSPQEIRPFPKAGNRKRNGICATRRKGESRILTDTPVKQQIEREARAGFRDFGAQGTFDVGALFVKRMAFRTCRTTMLQTAD
jgi:transposase